MDRSEINHQITEFASAFSTLPEIPEPPETTLNILRERTGEKYWNRLLRYFLDPSAAHGFGSDFLKEFVDLLVDQTEMATLDDFGLNAVQVESEISSDRGRPDLLLHYQDEWFICIELKVTAAETGSQTKEYANSNHLGDLIVDNYTEEQQHYVYLTKQTHSSPASDKFCRLYWRDVQAAIGRFLQNDRGQYPARSTAQLADFQDTIREETMSERPYDTQQQEYVELYLDHQDEIDTVRRAFERMVETQTDEWATRFQEHNTPDSWDKTWNCASDKYGKIYKDEWRRDENGEPVESWSEAAFRLEFRHAIRKEQSWKDGNVIFKTVIPRNSNEEYRERYHSEFNEQLNEVSAIIKSSNITVKGNQRTLMEARYSFEQTEGPEGYYLALAEAFEEHVILVPQLTEIYETAYTSLIE